MDAKPTDTLANCSKNGKLVDEGLSFQFFIACANGNVGKVFELSSREGVCFDYQNQFGYTPLIVSCFFNNAAVVRFLLSKGVSVNHQDHNGRTPLIIASTSGNEQLVRILIEAGADPFLRNAAGQNAFFLAALSKHKGVVAMLEEYAISVDPSKVEDMKQSSSYLRCLEACKEGSLERVREIVEDEDEMELLLNPEHGGYTPLYYATFFNRPAIVEYLMSKGAAIDTPDKNGSTPLMAAAQQGHERIVRILIAGGADPFLKTNLGETARDMVRNTQKSTIEYLLYSYEMRRVKQAQAEYSIERPLKKQRVSLNVGQLLEDHQRYLGKEEEEEETKDEIGSSAASIDSSLQNASPNEGDNDTSLAIFIEDEDEDEDKRELQAQQVKMQLVSPVSIAQTIRGQIQKLAGHILTLAPAQARRTMEIREVIESMGGGCTEIDIKALIEMKDELAAVIASMDRES